MEVSSSDCLGSAVSFEAIKVHVVKVEVSRDAKAKALKYRAVLVVVGVPLVRWGEARGSRAVRVVGANRAFCRVSGDQAWIARHGEEEAYCPGGHHHRISRTFAKSCRPGTSQLGFDGFCEGREGKTFLSFLLNSF